MSFFELLENTPKIFGFFGIFLLMATTVAFIFNFGFKFRIIGATIFSLLLSLSSWAFIQSYTEKVVIEGAKYVPIVYDNGFDLIIAKADNEFPEESIEPTLEQFSDGISKPVIIGKIQKNVKMN